MAMIFRSWKMCTTAAPPESGSPSTEAFGTWTSRFTWSPGAQAVPAVAREGVVEDLGNGAGARSEWTRHLPQGREELEALDDIVRPALQLRRAVAHGIDDIEPFHARAPVGDDQ